MLVKSADDKSSDLQLLEELQTKTLNKQQREWVNEKLWALRTGIQGEKDAAYYINAEYRDSENYAVLHDLRIEIDGETAQIDHLLVGHHFAFLLETKNFNGNISINERGEFSIEYAKGKSKGIPSPLEQSHRHERVFSKLLERLNIRDTSTGEKLRVRHIVLLSPNSIIQRPDSEKFDTSNVIKADALRYWREEFRSKELLRVKMLVPFVAKALLRPKNWISEPGPEVIREYGESIASCHQPAPPLVLPDFMFSDQQLASTSKPATQNSKNEPICTTCGQTISLAEARFCNLHKERFGGQRYCREHQQAFPSMWKNAGEVPPVPLEPSKSKTMNEKQGKIFCSEPDCNKILSVAVVAYCKEHAEKFDGKMYCMNHQRYKKKKAV